MRAARRRYRTRRRAGPTTATPSGRDARDTAAATDELTLYFQSLKLGRIRQPTFRTRSWSGVFTLELPRNNPTADRVKDYVLAAQLFAAQLHLADGGHAEPPAQDALHTFVDLLWSSEWCVLAGNGRLMPLAGGTFFYPDGLVTWSEQLSSAVG